MRRFVMITAGEACTEDINAKVFNPAVPAISGYQQIYWYDDFYQMNAMVVEYQRLIQESDVMKVKSYRNSGSVGKTVLGPMGSNEIAYTVEWGKQVEAKQVEWSEQ